MLQEQHPTDPGHGSHSARCCHLPHVSITAQQNNNNKNHKHSLREELWAVCDDESRAKCHQRSSDGNVFELETGQLKDRCLGYQSEEAIFINHLIHSKGNENTGISKTTQSRHLRSRKSFYPQSFL